MGSMENGGLKETTSAGGGPSCEISVGYGEFGYLLDFMLEMGVDARLILGSRAVEGNGAPEGVFCCSLLSNRPGPFGVIEAALN
jgi:hypothetical protein